MTPIDVARKKPCAACETPIHPTSDHCPVCGNNPRKEALLTVVATGIFCGVLYLIIPVAGVLLLPILLLLGVGLVLLDFSPTKTQSLLLLG